LGEHQNKVLAVKQTIC